MITQNSSNYRQTGDAASYTMAAGLGDTGIGKERSETKVGLF